MLAIALLWCSNLKSLQRRSLTTQAYADNWTWKTAHAADNGPAAAMTLKITAICGLTIDWLKTWLWASDDETASQARHSLEQNVPHADVTRLHHARDLGFELQYSSAHRIGHRQTRYDDALRRLERLAALPLELSVKEHVIQSSVYPTGFYGTEIFPVSEDQLAKFRTAAAEAMVGRAHTMTPALILLLAKPQILDPGFYVIAQAFRAAMLWLKNQRVPTRQLFYQCASSFTGSLRHVKGPASALKHYMSKFAWQIDKEGWVHVDTFVRVHLCHDRFPRMLHFLQIAWQQNLMQTMTARHSLYSLPDISRSDTLAVLKAFPDNQRLQLLREIAGAYQLEQQKAHWAEDTDGTCIFCQEADSRAHRLLHCPAFSDTRAPFHDLIRTLDEEGSHLPECPVVCVHPESMIHRTLHFQQPHACVDDAFTDFAYRRQMLHMPFHMYVDGSCSHPSSQSTRYSAYACVVDMAFSDTHRRSEAQNFLETGQMPKTFQTCFAGRTRGIQTIHNAETTALSIAASIPYGIIHTDSTCAIHAFLTYVAMPTTQSPCHEFLHQVPALSPDRVRKIKAHQDPRHVKDLLALYHVLGNMMVDQVAKTTCADMNHAWQTELEKYHTQIEMERNMMHDVCRLHVELFTARSIAAQKMSRLDDNHLPPEGKANLTPILDAIKGWKPQVMQQLTFPPYKEWFEFFSWGAFLAEQLYLWMQTTVWPVESGGPLEKEIGVSWLELGVSFSMYIQQALPILRPNESGAVRLLMIQDDTDVTDYKVTYTDLAATMQKMWCQAEGWILEESRPTCNKGLNTSLYTQGFGQSTSGLSPRPMFWAQDRVADHLRPILAGKQSYNVPFKPDWCEKGMIPIRNYDWKYLADRLKVVRRTWKGRGAV